MYKPIKTIYHDPLSQIPVYGWKPYLGSDEVVHTRKELEESLRLKNKRKGSNAPTN
jgi:hypothetical protein